jgi:hypothetical protein
LPTAAAGLCPETSEALSTEAAPDQRSIGELIAAWKAATEVWSATATREDAATLAAFALYPKLPETRAGAQFELWQAQCAAINRAYGLDVLHEACERDIDAANVIADELIATAPETVQEAADKYRTLLAICDDGIHGVTEVEPFRAFLGDLERLAMMEQVRNMICDLGDLKRSYAVIRKTATDKPSD